MKNKILGFNANISNVENFNPLFSKCNIRVLYTGDNRNQTNISKESVERALPSIKNIPIVGEFSNSQDDFLGHGGRINQDTYEFEHTTKPIGIVPESATYYWEDVRGIDGKTRTYLTVNDCFLWTGRYKEAQELLNSSKGQSMEISVSDGFWDANTDTYVIKDFLFSALCVLGNDFPPAFEDASITCFSNTGSDNKNNESEFAREFSLLKDEFEKSLSKDKEVENMLKELLEKYSVTMELLTSKGFTLDDVSEDNLEQKILETLGNIEKEVVEVVEEIEEAIEEVIDDIVEGDTDEVTDEVKSDEDDTDTDTDTSTEDSNEYKEQVFQLQKEVEKLNEYLKLATEELEPLREFKMNVERAEFKSKVDKMIASFQLSESDIKDLDIFSMTIEELEDKCYAIIGRKISTKKGFSLNSNQNIHLKVNTLSEDLTVSKYGSLFEEYGSK